MKPTVIVWDLETVPDLAGFAAANDLVGKRRGPRGDWREVPEAYLPLDRLHRRLGGGRRRRALSGREDGEGAHHRLLRQDPELRPHLVTFNGNSFDLPVLRYRAMIQGVSAPGLSLRPYFNRYTEDAIDLCYALSSFSPQGKATLHEITKVMGLPGKPKGQQKHRSGSS